MNSVSPEFLVQTWLGEGSAAASATIVNEPLYVPYDRLSEISGWTVWLGHPPIPDWITLFPAPEELLWGEPVRAIGVALMVAADYAVRRGAVDPAGATRILLKESPVVVIVPGDLHQTVTTSLARLASCGIPVIHGQPGSRSELAASAPPFAVRDRLHMIDLGRPHDPACAFEAFTVADSMGGNAFSSFVVHNRGERDQVSITGERSARMGIEIGLGGDSISVEQTQEIERFAASIPGFLSGVSSTFEGNSLTIGWRDGAQPDPGVVGDAFRIYLKTMRDVPFVDVRIAFAPPDGRSSELTEMRARARGFRTYRLAVVAGETDPRFVVDDHRPLQLD